MYITFTYGQKQNLKEKKILLEYINRPRAINPEKTKFSSPANYLTKKQIENITSISAEFDNILSSINNILDYICLINKKNFGLGLIITLNIYIQNINIIYLS